MKYKKLKDIHFRSRRLWPQRKYKDKLFRLIFREPGDLLELYNAVNNTQYTDPKALTIVTMEDAVYLGMKNDVAFLIGSQINLYEHQSSWNPNMPLRGLFYFANMFRNYVESQGLNLYSSALVKLPTPRYIIFYNGTQERIDRMELKLSDAFEKTEKEVPALECRAILLNVNQGHNQELMEKCRRLADYATFVQKVREGLEAGESLETAVSQAVDYCIAHGILEDILRKNRAEVLDVILTTYNKKQHEKFLRAEGREEGREEGSERVNALNRRLLEDGRKEDLLRSVQDSKFQKKLLEEYHL